MASREYILGSINDLVANFLYYDRKNDEELPVGAIESAIADSTVTVDEIVERFRDQLVKGLE